MSRNIGFLVVNARTGYVLEGKDHAAKIFDTEPIARRACTLLQVQKPLPLSYESAVQSLLKGSAFCFETADGHARFLTRLRHDLANRPLVAYSGDRAYIRWRHSNEKNDAKTEPGAGVAADLVHEAIAALGPSVEAPKTHA